MSKADLYEFLGIDPPVDLEAEQAVLGAILVEPNVWEQVHEELMGGEFASQPHARIYRAMRQLSDAEKPIDLISLTSQLKDSEELEGIGGVSYLTRLANAVPTAANVGYYTELVREKFLRRQAIDTTLHMLKHAVHQPDVGGFVATAEAAIHKLGDMAAPAKEYKRIKDVLMEVWEDAEQRYNVRDTNRGITGIESGYPDLDRMTAGFQRSDLIIVAARPSVGKTAFALNIAQNAGYKIAETIAIFSLEMSARQLTQRMLCAEGSIDASRMRTGFFEEDDWCRMSMAVGRLSEAPIVIDDEPGLTVNEIRAKCRRIKKERGLGMILIDYLQLIQGSGRRGTNRQEEVSQISRTLKQIARELDVPVIALSQLSRGVEQRTDKRPMMSDLRESGAIEQDADIVAFLYRDDYYDKESEKKNIIEIIIAKQRNGPVGTVELLFEKQYNRFRSLPQTYRTDASLPPEPERPKGKAIPDMYRGRKERGA